METNKTPQYLNQIFHVNLSDKFANEDYWLHVASKKYPLAEHTADTRAEARQQQPALAAVPDEQLTHYTQEPVPLKLGTVIRISVRHTNKTGIIPGSFGLHLVAIHIVPDNETNQSLAVRGVAMIVPDTIDWVSTAKSVVFHHADLATANPDFAPIVMEHMDQYKAPSNYAMIQELANYMSNLGAPTTYSGWATYELFDAGDEETHYTTVPVNDVIVYAGDAMTAVQVSTKNDLRLKDSGSWTQETGTSVQSGIPPTEGDDASLAFTGKTAMAVSSDNWTAALSNINTSNGLQTKISVKDAAARKVHIKMTNTYVRWLGAYIQFTDAEGKIMDTPDTPNWHLLADQESSASISDLMNDLNLEYPNLRFIGWMSPIDTFMAVPNYALPGELEVDIYFPDGAVSANLYGCGLGTGENKYPNSLVIGGVLTGLANLAIPTFLLGFGVAAQSNKGLYDAMNDKTLITAAITAGIVYFGAQFTYEGAVNKKMDWNAFSSMSQILFVKGCDKALKWAEAQIVEGQLKDEIPFAGWFMLAIQIATGLAQMAETIAEVATSPWMITNRIATTIDSTVTVHPDPMHGAFPQGPSGSVSKLVINMTFKNENRPVTPLTQSIDPNKYPPAISGVFTNTLGGGQVKFEATFYINNWPAAAASTSWLENDEIHTANIILYLVQVPIPLDEHSVYIHTAILGYQNNVYTWRQQAAPPTATLANSDNSQTGNAISLWTGLALSQRYAQIGLSWKAAGMNLVDCSTGASGQISAFQSVNIPGAKYFSAFPDCGFTAPTHLIYDVFPPKFLMENGQYKIVNGYPVPDPNDISLGNYYIDPRKSDGSDETDGGYHLRKVDLNQTSFNMSANQTSYGRFPYYPDSVALHPSGHVIGVNSQYCKLMVTRLARDGGLADNNIPLAITFAGRALNLNGSNGRAGLLFTPKAVTCSYDGTILVLEQLSSYNYSIARVQAFDLNGNPVQCFIDAVNNITTPFLLLPNNVTYLDMAAVGDSHSTFLYILYYTGSGQTASEYHMSIYQFGENAPAGNLLVTTPNVAAAKLNVDMWHTMYTLNYQMTQDGSGHNAGPVSSGTAPAGRTVPSVSEWLPPVPDMPPVNN
jgi:hypothetical protein